MAELEPNIAEKWLYQQLTADSTLAALGVFSVTVPTRNDYPAVVFVARPEQGGGDVNVINGEIVMARLMYIVRASTAGMSYGPISQAAALIHKQLHLKSGNVTGGKVLACTRVHPFSYAEEEEGGDHYRHMGGVYRLFVQSDKE
jgi:hypothetical protein